MKEETLELRRAKEADLPAIRALLESCSLPTGDLAESLPGSFCISEVDGEIVGVSGVEMFGSNGLLRSLAVAPPRRGRGLAARLVDWCEDQARRDRVTALYLLTTTAADYFRRRGYDDVPRESAPASISGHPQFRGLCPASAKCLRKQLT